LPVAFDGVRGFGVAIARHVHQHDGRCRQREEIELAGAAGLVGDAGERLAAGQRVEEGGLAYV
jgi:predicted nicotinamide N-methyase